MKNNKKLYSIAIIMILLIFMIYSSFNWDYSFYSGPKVGVLEIKTPIMDSREVIRDLNYFIDEANVDAIVIRLNTPGGGVAASQEIYEKVKSISKKNEKPIIASMGGVAASGGYYVALGADTIIANPGTATGSIGVIMSYPIIKELFDKMGIKQETVKSGEMKDAGSFFKSMNLKERKYWQELIDDLHDQFISTVAVERNMLLEDVKKIADGRVYSGRQAVNLDLIDILGTLEDAILLASHLTGSFEKPLVINPPKEKNSLLNMLIGNIFKHNRMEEFIQYPNPQYRLN